MKIGIITAMPEETRAVLKAAEGRSRSLISGRRICRCRIADHDVVLVEAGMGLLNAGWAAMSLGCEAPDVLISAGFGGGVLPGLAVGEVVMAEQVLHWLGSGFEQVAVGFYGRNSVAEQLSLSRGTFITSDGILNKKAVASHLSGAVKNPLVEMESAAVARVAAEQRIPFLGLRVVSDPWNEELDFSIAEFCDDSLRIKPVKVLATILKRPRIIPQLIRLARNSRIAAQSLANAMERLLQHI